MHIHSGSKSNLFRIEKGTISTTQRKLSGKLFDRDIYYLAVLVRPLLLLLLFFLFFAAHFSIANHIAAFGPVT